MAFWVGQKVVCVKDGGEWSNGFREIEGPVYRQVYTIREIVTDTWGAGLRLEEIRLPPEQFAGGISEPRFKANHFRPVKTTSTGLAILNRLLLPKPARKRARVPV